MRKPRSNAQQIEEAVSYVFQNHSIQETAEKYNVAIVTLRKRLHKLRSLPFYTNDSAAEVVKILNEKGLVQTAKYYHCTKKTMKKFIEQNNISFKWGKDDE